MKKSWKDKGLRYPRFHLSSSFHFMLPLTLLVMEISPVQLGSDDFPTILYSYNCAVMFPCFSVSSSAPILFYYVNCRRVPGGL
jgi:hypothetical protein